MLEALQCNHSRSRACHLEYHYSYRPTPARWNVHQLRSMSHSAPSAAEPTSGTPQHFPATPLGPSEMHTGLGVTRALIRSRMVQFSAPKSFTPRSQASGPANLQTCRMPTQSCMSPRVEGLSQHTSLFRPLTSIRSICRVTGICPYTARAQTPGSHSWSGLLPVRGHSKHTW